MSYINEDEFWSLADKKGISQCWIWQGKIDNPRNGKYGRFTLRKEDGKWIGRKYQSAHRIAYLLHSGEIPDGKWVLHKCGNGMCVNPVHLYLGTAKDNNLKNQKRY